MSGVGYFSERNAYGVLGSIFGVVGPLITIYVLSLGGDADIIIRATEAVVWALWLSIQGIGFYVIYQRNRETLFLFIFMLGLIAALYEILAVLWIIDPQNEVGQLIAISLLGISSFNIYLILCAFIMFKTPDNEYAKFAGFLLLIAAVFDTPYLAVASAVLILANITLRMIFGGYGTPKQH
jgi:hypothetical protein